MSARIGEQRIWPSNCTTQNIVLHILKLHCRWNRSYNTTCITQIQTYLHSFAQSSQRITTKPVLGIVKLGILIRPEKKAKILTSRAIQLKLQYSVLPEISQAMSNRYCKYAPQCWRTSLISAWTLLERDGFGNSGIQNQRAWDSPSMLRFHQLPYHKRSRPNFKL